MSSNMIKGYTLNYDRETVRRLDLTRFETAINKRAEELSTHQKEIQEAARILGFLEGIDAPQFDEEGNPVIPEIIEDNVEDDYDSPILMSRNELNELKEQMKEEILSNVMDEAELRVREKLRAESEEILENARAEAGRIIAEAIENAKKEGEAAKTGIVSAASSQGYEEGMKRAMQEQSSSLEALESRRRELEGNYQRQVADLEPAFVKILQEYLKKITGMSYAKHTDVFKYLIDKGINNAPKDSDFTVYLSKEDYDRFLPEFDSISSTYTEKFNLNFSIDRELSVGAFRLENESTIIECGLESELNGLLDSLNLLM